MRKEGHPKGTLEEFSSKILAKIPEAPPVAPDPSQVPSFRPENFYQLYAKREELQTARLRLARHPYVQGLYADYQTLLGQTAENGTTIFERGLDVHTSKNGLTITDPFMFSYDLPTDIVHLISWYREGVTREQRAKAISAIPWLTGYSPLDLVVVVNPINWRSVQKFGHDHLFVRWEGGNQHFQPLPNPLKIFGLI